MIIGSTRIEAREIWSNGGDVICPGCELYIDEHEDTVVQGKLGLVWHAQCLGEDNRLQSCIAASIASE